MQSDAGVFCSILHVCYVADGSSFDVNRIGCIAIYDFINEVDREEGKAVVGVLPSCARKRVATKEGLC